MAQALTRSPEGDRDCLLVPGRHDLYPDVPGEAVEKGDENMIPFCTITPEGDTLREEGPTVVYTGEWYEEGTNPELFRHLDRDEILLAFQAAQMALDLIPSMLISMADQETCNEVQDKLHNIVVILGPSMDVGMEEANELANILLSSWSDDHIDLLEEEFPEDIVDALLILFSETDDE